MDRKAIMAARQQNDPTPPPASGPSGVNPLLLGVGLALALGVLAGSLAGDSTLLRSNIVFRFVVGGCVAAFCYGGVAARWLAYHRRIFRRFGAAGAGIEAPEQAAEAAARDDEINEFMDTTTKALEEINKRLETLENSGTSK